MVKMAIFKQYLFLGTAAWQCQGLKLLGVTERAQHPVALLQLGSEGEEPNKKQKTLEAGKQFVAADGEVFKLEEGDKFYEHEQKYIKFEGKDLKAEAIKKVVLDLAKKRTKSCMKGANKQENKKGTYNANDGQSYESLYRADAAKIKEAHKDDEDVQAVLTHMDQGCLACCCSTLTCGCCCNGEPLAQHIEQEKPKA